MRPRVADQLHEGARAGQVGHQAERRLRQPQLASSASTRRSQASASWAAGADRVPLHGGDRDDARRAQPAEAGLVPADALLGLLGGQPPQVAQPAAVRRARR